MCICNIAQMAEYKCYTLVKFFTSLLMTHGCGCSVKSSILLTETHPDLFNAENDRECPYHWLIDYSQQCYLANQYEDYLS